MRKDMEQREKDIRITRERANKIIEECMNGPKRQVVICYRGQWYDIRSFTDEEIRLLIITLTGVDFNGVS